MMKDISRPYNTLYTIFTYLLTYLLTHSMVQEILWKSDSHSAFFMEPESLLLCSQKPAHLTLSWASRIQFFSIAQVVPKNQSRSLALWNICNKLHFYGEGLLAIRPTLKLEDHPL